MRQPARFSSAFLLCLGALHSLPFPAAAQDFAPTNIANCELWLKADAESVRTNSEGRVSQWTDSSGRGHHASQDNPLYQARFETGAVNGLPALRFDGVDDFLSIAHHGDLEAGSGLTVFFVCEGTNAFRMMQKGNGAGTDNKAWFLSPAPVMGVAGTWKELCPALGRIAAPPHPAGRSADAWPDGIPVGKSAETALLDQFFRASVGWTPSPGASTGSKSE